MKLVIGRRGLQFVSIFAVRCYASAAYATMRCPPVCLSVPVSVTFVHSVKTNKDILYHITSYHKHICKAPYAELQRRWDRSTSTNFITFFENIFHHTILVLKSRETVQVRRDFSLTKVTVKHHSSRNWVGQCATRSVLGL